jgi:PAS domain S-box-containing protein
MRKHYIEIIGGTSIKPLTLTRFWHRRICEAIMLIASIILALYIWAMVSGVTNVGQSLLISDTVAVLAGAAFIISLTSYFFLPKERLFWGSFTAFLLLAVTTAALIMTTGDTSSPFIALWMIVGVFAGIFGVYGLLPLFVAAGLFMIIQYSVGTLARESIVTIVLAGELPLAISYLIWHTKKEGDTSADRTYRDLATELNQVANKSEVVINAIADGVIAVNDKGVIQLINPAAQQIIGWGKQDALALDYKSVLKLLDNKGNEVTPATDPIAAALSTNKQVTDNTLTLLTNSQKKLLVSINVSPVGQLGSGVIIVFRDITKEKSEEREQAEFISTASHEMRTPVASIEGYLGLALNPATATIDVRGRDFINKAHESAQHLGRLFQDLLDVTKADDGRLSNNPKVVDVVAFTHDILQGLKPRADEKGLRTLFKPLPDTETSERRLNPVYYVNVDNDHLREVIGNLIENAIKYTPKGDVVIDITGDNDKVTISVADSGIGIPKEDQAHLFQKFYRVDNSETREIGGTGLGLYLCRRLVETMQGRLWVESEYKQGSTFFVELPRTSHEDAMKMIEAASVQQEAAVISDPQVYPTYQEPAEQPQVSPLESPQPLTQQPPVMQVPPQQQQPTYAAPQAYQSTPATQIAPQPIATQPAQQPIPQPLQATPVPPQPAEYSPQIPRPMSSRPQPNTPLSAIERNPGQFTQYRNDGPSVPPRA